MEDTSLFIGRSATLRDAMHQLDNTSSKILFVVEDHKFSATLTDGDIRRFLLAGGKLEDSVALAANHNPRVACSHADAVRLYHQHDYVAIPILDKDKNVLDIYWGNNQPQKIYDLNIPVVINSGGKGTRLDPFTRVLPKPLIPVGDLPIIEHIMQRFMEYACDRFHIIVNYKKQLIKAYFAESEKRYDVSFYDEEKPLGTGGGLSLLKGKISETFFFSNCDVLLQSNYDSILRFHREHKNAVTVVCAYKDVTIPYGVIEMGLNGSIEAMKEKPQFSFLTNTGMYIVEPEVLDDIEEDVAIGFPDIIELQRKKGRNVAVYPVSDGDWLDMGQMPELEKMRVKLYGE